MVLQLFQALAVATLASHVINVAPSIFSGILCKFIDNILIASCNLLFNTPHVCSLHYL